MDMDGVFKNNIITCLILISGTTPIYVADRVMLFDIAGYMYLLMACLPFSSFPLNLLKPDKKNTICLNCSMPVSFSSIGVYLKGNIPCL